LKFTIPEIKPEEITLEMKYPLKFELKDNNPDEPKTATYTLYVQIYDPNYNHFTKSIKN